MSDKSSLSEDDFARHVEKTNPFAQDRVTQVRKQDADVGSIHDKAFKKLAKRIEETREDGRASGVLLTGDPGIGKSHVLARLFRWAKEEGDATVVYLHNILASPERMGRYLLHATVSNLAGYRSADFAQSDLYSIINLAINARLPTRKGKSRGMAPTLAVRKEVLQDLGREIDPDQLVMPVFVAFLEQAVGANLAEESAEARSVAAVQWLSGDTIDPDVARSIGLRVNGEDGAHIEDDVAVQRTIDVLCRLCACARRPFVLCLDQVDNLAAESVRALASFVHALIDNGHNLVVVTSGVRESMDRLERDRVIPGAAYDRLAEHRINLNAVSVREAHAIVLERVEQFCAPFAKVKGVSKARSKDALTPLTSAWWESFQKSAVEFRPRDVIRRARDAWAEEQERLAQLGAAPWLDALTLGGAPADGKSSAPEGDRRRANASKSSGKAALPPERLLPPLEQRIDALVRLKLTEAKEERELNPTRLPPDGDNLATLTMTLLQSCAGFPGYTLRSTERVGRGKTACYDLWVTEETAGGQSVTNGLRFFTEDNALSAVNALKRMQADGSPPTHQLFVTDQERRPLKLATKGKEVFEALSRGSRFTHIGLRFADHAQLDGLSSVLGAARVGDLDVEQEPGVYRAITEEECRESLHRQGFFVQHLLLRELLSEEPQPPVPTPDHTETQASQVRAHIKGELAFALSMTAQEMATIIVSRTSQPSHVQPRIWELVKSVARQMHQDRELFVDAQNDDLFLQLA